MQIAPWLVIPFALLLLAIAVLPLVAERFWHSNWRKALVSVGLSLPVVLYLLHIDYHDDQPGLQALFKAGEEYINFIVLLAALYTVAGGIAIQGQFRPTPFVNVGILGLGAVLANLIGTTGASMLLIRPFLRINQVRQHRGHLPIFFIFVVSNLGGLLTPLGDPPLFLGFLNGVDFFWTLSLFPHWLVANSIVLLIALAWDSFAYWREPDREHFPPRHGTIVVAGLINVVFLLGIIAAVLAQSRLRHPWPSVFMAALAVLSWLFTSRTAREHNEFTWHPIIEIAVVFFGIFATMIPALALLVQHHASLSITEPWQYFWLTGGLSSVLDNAPTYMAFATLAAEGSDLTDLSLHRPRLLQAISAGAVFMGANTYIGNGPNFMVKSIAESMGYPMPSFLGYVLYAALILLPVFGLVSWLFFVG